MEACAARGESETEMKKFLAHVKDFHYFCR